MPFCWTPGNLQVHKPNQFLLMSLDGVLYPKARLKPGLIPTHKGPTRTMSELRNAAQIAYSSDTAAKHLC